jgi:hypothetical protein
MRLPAFTMPLEVHYLVLPPMLSLPSVLLVDTLSYHDPYSYILVRLLPPLFLNPLAQLASYDGQLGFGPNASVPDLPLTITPPLPASNGPFQKPLPEYPFGPATNSQPMTTGYLGLDKAATMDMPFPNNLGTVDILNGSHTLCCTILWQLC